MFALDHLVIAAETLDAGTAFAEARLGVPLAPGGQHHFMGTHNRLLALGPDTYLEVIAIDPSLPHPGRTRWFGLDRFTGDPRLVAWVLSTPDMRNVAQMPGTYHAPEDLVRGDLRWQMSVPISAPLGDLAPPVLHWPGDKPQNRLPDAGVSMTSLSIRHPDTGQLPKIADPRVTLNAGTPGISAHLTTPQGKVSL